MILEYLSLEIPDFNSMRLLVKVEGDTSREGQVYMFKATGEDWESTLYAFWSDFNPLSGE